MDGVVTETARAHAASWKQMFDAYLKEYSDTHGPKYKAFDDKKDYYRYVDGKPRYQGVASFLKSRGIVLPYGNPHDAPDRETVCGLGNRKNCFFHDYLKENGAKAYQSTIEFLQKIKNRNMGTAVISSSRNAKAVLTAAGVQELFQVMVDGVYAAEHNLKGKPDPDIFLEAARQLKVAPEQALVIEDAISGVEAAKKGGFGFIIGIDRTGSNAEIKNHGADVVVNDLSEIRSEKNEYAS
jgi:alpha,alpha-trehalase